MKSLRIKGFRSILDTGKVELKPITAIIGKNSCGKSSFIRFFPLLKQSTEKEISETLLWFGEYVDFGDYKSIKPKFNVKTPTSFEIEFDISDIDRYSSFDFDLENKLEKVYLTLTMEIAEKHIPFLSLAYFDQKIEIFMNENGSVDKIFINGRDAFTANSKYFWSKDSRLLIPALTNTTINNDEYIFFFKDRIMERELKSIISNILPKNTDREKIQMLCHLLTELRSQEALFNFLCTYKDLPKISTFFKTQTMESEYFIAVNTYSILSKLPYYIQIINRILINETENIHYLKPIRASVNRYYRIQGLSINHVDADGSNLAMILHNLSTSERMAFEKWTQENFDIKFSVAKSAGHTSLIVFDRNGNAINLADTGYGYSQILPVIVELWLLLKKKSDDKTITIVIEQPELHLHPAFQAKVIDLFANIVQQAQNNNIDLKIIFETHSETMINRLGYLINKKIINANDVNILAFDKGDMQTTITPKQFDEEGFVLEWPVGFFSAEE